MAAATCNSSRQRVGQGGRQRLVKPPCVWTNPSACSPGARPATSRITPATTTMTSDTTVTRALLIRASFSISTSRPSTCAGPKQLAASVAAPSPAPAGGAAPKDGIAAPLAGNVWKIEVTEGQRVQEGDLLLILEAMKMENEILADKDGTVGQLLVQEGNKVEIGQILLTLV